LCKTVVVCYQITNNRITDMDLYYAIINNTVVGLTWAEDREHALSQIEFALAEEGIYDLEDIDLQRMPANAGTLILNT